MKVLITGAKGLLGRTIAQQWPNIRGEDELVLVERSLLDLTDNSSVNEFFYRTRPDLVIHTAAKVSGILARQNSPRDYLSENLKIDINVIEASVTSGVPNFVYASSAAIYPENAEQPIKENQLFMGPLEDASLCYGLAKLVGTQQCMLIDQEQNKNYKSLIFSNIFGHNDFGHDAKNHLIASALSKTVVAKESGSPEVEIWGDGLSKREFVFANDIGNWLSSEIEKISTWPSVMNLGYGIDFSVRDLYRMAAEVVGFKGTFSFDITKPNGTRKRVLDSSLAKQFGWSPNISPLDGMRIIYSTFNKG